MGGWYGLHVILLSSHVLYVGFTPVYIGQDRLSGNPVYVSLHRFTLVGRDMELDNKTQLSKLKPKTEVLFSH